MKRKEGFFMARFCSECGAQISENARFCKNCGTPCVQEEPVQAQPTYTEPAPAPAPEAQPKPPVEFAYGKGKQEEPAYRQDYQPAAQSDPSRWQDSYNAAPASPYYGAPQPPAPKKNKNGLIIALIAIAVLLAAGIVVLIILNPFADKSDANKNADSTASQTVTEATAAPTQPEDTTAPTQPLETADPIGSVSTALRKGGAESVQAVLDRLVEIDTSEQPDIDSFLELVYEYQFTTDSELREEISEYVADYYDSYGDSNPRAEFEAEYGSGAKAFVTITSSVTLTGEDLNEVLDVLRDNDCEIDQIEEVVYVTYTIGVVGSTSNDGDEFELVLVKANGKWYYSELN